LAYKVDATGHRLEEKEGETNIVKLYGGKPFDLIRASAEKNVELQNIPAASNTAIAAM